MAALRKEAAAVRVPASLAVARGAESEDGRAVPEIALRKVPPLSEGRRFWQVGPTAHS